MIGQLLVVGGTSGIGYAAARRIALDGADQIMLAGRDASRAERAASALAAETQADIRATVADAGSPDGADAAVAACVAAFGGIGALVSCAGGGALPRLLKDMGAAEVARDLQDVARPVILPAAAAYRAMRGTGGAIVTVASDAAKVPTPGEAAIGAGMAAIAMFTRTLAIEGKRDGVRANCVTPSIVRGTALYDTLMADPFSARLFGKAEAAAVLGVPEPEDLASTIAFLTSPAASKVTGQVVSVNGGISAG